MNKFYLLLLVLLSPALYAQDTIADSIRKHLVQNEHENLAYLQDLVALQRHYLRTEDYDSALYYGHTALDLSQKISALEILADVYNGLGNLYQYRGQFQKANDYGFKSLRLKDSLHLGPIALAESHGNISLSFQDLGQFEDALRHQKLAYKYFLEGKDSIRTATRLYMIGGLLYEMGRYDSARYYYDEAKDWYSALGKEGYLAIYHTYIGLIDLKEDRLRDAEKQFLTSLGRYPEDGAKRLKVYIYINLAVVNLVMGAERDSVGETTLKKAIDYATLTYNLSEELDFPQQKRKANEILYKAYDALGQPDKAIKYAREYITLSDSLYSVEQQEVIAEMQTKYETGKKDAEIEFLSIENQLNAENLRQRDELVQSQRNVIIILSIAAVIVILFGLQTYRLYHQRQKAISELEATNKVISKQFEEREILLKEIHHRVKNNLQVISSLLDLQSSSISDPQALVAVEDGQSRVKAMALIHQKLYQNEDLSVIKLKDFLEKLVEQNGEINGASANFKCRLSDDKMSLDIDTAVPVGLILNELITNAYKYGANAEGKVELELDLRASDSGYIMEFKDSGPGLPDGFDWAKSRNLGMRLINRLSRQLYGSVSYKYQQGATFTIQFKDTQQRKDIA